MISDENQRKEVFAWFGAASYGAQCVEIEFWIARLTLARKGNTDPTNAEWHEIESESLTFGKLLTRIKEHVTIPADGVNLLEECRDKRNWLAHQYWDERNHLLATAEGCEEAIGELQALCELFKKGDSLAQEISVRLRAQIGIPETLVDDLKEEYSRRLAAGEDMQLILAEQRQYLERLSQGENPNSGE